MIRTTILAATLMSATALVTVPAAAYTNDGDQGRQSRNWTGNQSDTANTSTVRTRRGTAANQRGNTSTSSGSRDVPSNDTASNSNDGDDDNHGYRRQHHEDAGGLDPAEAARIRRAHEETDGHVYMRRSHDEDGAPAYRSGYSTTYQGEHGREFEAPRRRHHWWHAWWN
jgi:hypothetical protein